MTVIDLGGTWRFQRDSTIDVPAFWEARGHLELDGLAIYERDVEVAHATRAHLEFDAVADLCEVFVNGELVGTHEVGFTPFAFEVALREGVNTIRVDVTDPGVGDPDHLRTPQGKQGWANRFFPSPPSVYITYGGIWQPCRLVLHGPSYIDDLWCDMRPGTPTIGVSVTGDVDRVEVHAFGMTRVLSGSGTVQFDTDAGVWDPGHPVLHEIRAVAVGSHERTLITGLRSLERNGDDLLINGRPYRMRSALHQGFWPDGLYAADRELIERDVRLALDAGLNTIRTHLKAFEPAWLDAADSSGLLLQCDTPIGEPLSDASLFSDETFIRRCVTSLTEQVKRDRSRPSILMWTLMNEVALRDASMLDRDDYRDLVKTLTDALRELDPDRPIVENDWVADPPRLVATDIRTPHWYGRSTKAFLDIIDKRLTKAAEEPGPLYVTEFGEWGLPSPENGSSFWDQDEELAALITESGWRGSIDDFLEATQELQGWSDRIQAERFRTHDVVRGFCLTEWTDVPHEFNGLVTLRRNVKRSVEAFRPALADVAPIAVLDRFAYAEGERLHARLYVSNWSAEPKPAGEMRASLGAQEAVVSVPAVDPGHVVAAGSIELDATPGSLQLAFRGHRSTYPVHVCRSTMAAEMPANVLIEPEDSPELEPVPLTWGPTPILFTTTGLQCVPEDTVLVSELFDCFPETYLPSVRGLVNILIPPPVSRWGAVVAARDDGAVTTLNIGEALARGEGFASALAADLQSI